MLYLNSSKWKIPFILSLFSTIIFSLTIIGNVIDENGNPISNVNIYSVISGTTTDENGYFKLKIEKNSEITISHIGFEEIQINSENLKEVIVLKKSTLLGKNVNVNSSLDKRDLYNTPSSFSLITSNELSVKSNNHFEGLIDQITNLNYASGTSRPRYFQIRGIGERSHYAGEGPPNYSVGFLIDGMDFSGIGMVGHLFDVKQIEVFKGPQSTVFGPNAVAGSINITTNNPTPFYTGKFESNFSTDNGKTFAGAISGPIINSLSFRISGIKHSQNGFRENVFTNSNNSNGKDEFFIRTKLHWNPISDLSFNFLNFNSDLNNKYDAWAPDNNEGFVTYTNNQGRDSQKSFTNSLVINLPEIRGINSKIKLNNNQTSAVHSYDGDWGNEIYWLENHGFDPTVEGWSYEFWDEINREKSINSNEVIFNTTENLNLPFNSKIFTGIYNSSISQIDTATGWLFGGDATDLNSEYEIKNIAFYGNLTSKILSNIELNFSIRFENYSIDYFADGENWGYPINIVDTNKIDNFYGLNFSLKYQLNEKLLVYNSFSKGYKAGGINQHPSLNEVSQFYNPEYNLNYEFGGRLSWKKLNINFALFMMQRTDLQVQISNQQDESNPNSFTYFTSNASTGSNSGFEIESSFEFTSNLSLNYCLGLLNTYVDVFSYPIGLDSLTNLIYESSGDRELAMAPKFNSSLNIHYTHNSGLFVNGNITSKDKYYFSDSHDQMSNPYSILNLDLGYRKNNFTISLWIKNITDERYAVRGFYFGLEPPIYEDKLYLSYGNPKEIGIKLSYKF